MSRRHVWLAAQAAVTVVLLVFLFRRFDWARFADVLRHMSPAFYAGSLLAVAAGNMFYAWRWRVVLGGMGIQVPYAEVLRQYLIGLFFNNIMPTSIGGDAARVYYLGKRAGYLPVGASVFVDRFLGFFWLAVFGAVLAWVVGADSGLLVLNRNLLTLLAVAFVTMVAAIWLVPVETLLTRFVPGRWESLTARLSEFVVFVRDGACRPFTFCAAGAVVMFYMWLIASVYRQHFAANDVPAIAILPVMLVIVSMSIFVNVPISVNGIGLREQLHVLLFTALGIPNEVSVSISLLLFSHSLLLGLVGCGVWLKVRPAAMPSAI